MERSGRREHGLEVYQAGDHSVEEVGDVWTLFGRAEGGRWC